MMYLISSSSCICLCHDHVSVEYRNAEHEAGCDKESSLMIELLQIGLELFSHALLGHDDDVAVAVAALVGDGVDPALPLTGGVDGDVPAEDAERIESLLGDGAARVVQQTLVAGKVVHVVRAHDALRDMSRSGTQAPRIETMGFMYTVVEARATRIKHRSPFGPPYGSCSAELCVPTV